MGLKEVCKIITMLMVDLEKNVSYVVLKLTKLNNQEGLLSTVQHVKSWDNPAFYSKLLTARVSLRQLFIIDSV